MMQKGDFTAGVRLLWIVALAIVIGAIRAFVALVLLWLIGLFTHLFYFPAEFFDNLFHSPGRLLVLEPMSPGKSTLGWPMIFVPVVGGLIIGLMARYGSDRIRGHGIPEALEAILIGRSRMSPKVAVLKPLSSAISIGSGGPFGAEGPIIMTGGAFGSIIAQVFHLTAAERKTLLVAGAAGGMAATFATPIAAVLLAVELLLFEWKPRSFIPVALASAVAALIRPLSAGRSGPLFPLDHLHGLLGVDAMLSSSLRRPARRRSGIGPDAGRLRLRRTCFSVCRFTGCGGRPSAAWSSASAACSSRAPWASATTSSRICCRGNYVIAAAGAADSRQMLHLVARRSARARRAACWRRLLIMGGATRRAGVATSCRAATPRLWPLVGMAAVMGGTMRSPLTGTIFALELTHDINALPALLIASVDRARLHGAGDEALDPDREGRPARLPRQPRIRRRSTGTAKRRGSDDERRGHGAGVAAGARPAAAATSWATASARTRRIRWWTRTANSWES